MIENNIFKSGVFPLVITYVIEDRKLNITTRILKIWWHKTLTLIPNFLIAMIQLPTDTLLKI